MPWRRGKDCHNLRQIASPNPLLDDSIYYGKIVPLRLQRARFNLNRKCDGIMADVENSPGTSSDWKSPQPKPRFGVFEFVVGAVFCVGFPGLVTAMVPVSWLEFHRLDHRVDVETRTCAFFVVPYRTQQLAGVRSVSTAFRQGDLRHRRPGDNKRGREESEGTVRLHGPLVNGEDGTSISVSVSPASYKSVEAQIQKFLADPQQQNLTLFTVANWKFGVLFAIPLCLLTVLFVVGWSIWLARAVASPFLNLFAGNGNEFSRDDEEAERS